MAPFTLFLCISLSLSLSILFGSVHFSLECLSSQTSLCSSLPLLNTNKTHTTQVKQGARAQCDKRLTHHSITRAVNCPLFTLCRLLGTAAWLGPCKIGCPYSVGSGSPVGIGHCHHPGRDFSSAVFWGCGFSVFYSLPTGPCSPRGSRDLLENGGCATTGCELPAWPTHHLFKSYFVAENFKICSIHTSFGRVLKGRMIPEGLCSLAGSSG